MQRYVRDSVQTSPAREFVKPLRTLRAIFVRVILSGRGGVSPPALHPSPPEMTMGGFIAPKHAGG